MAKECSFLRVQMLQGDIIIIKCLILFLPYSLFFLQPSKVPVGKCCISPIR